MRSFGLERRTATIVELWLRPLGSVLEYLPGEYVLLEDDHHEVPPRSFSLANAPRPDGLISLLVTRVPTERAARWVHDRLRVGRPSESPARTEHSSMTRPRPRLPVPGCRLGAGADPRVDRGGAASGARQVAGGDLLGADRG